MGEQGLLLRPSGSRWAEPRPPGCAAGCGLPYRQAGDLHPGSLELAEGSLLLLPCCCGHLWMVTRGSSRVWIVTQAVISRENGSEASSVDLL